MTNKKVIKNSAKPLISVVMGSQSDFATMKEAVAILEEFGVNFEVKIVSAHRTPDRLYKYATGAKNKGIKVIIAAAGGAAHLPGMIASMTIVPVLGVPIETSNLKGIDSLLSIVQMPAGIPVGTLAIGLAGAKNSALMAIGIIANNDEMLTKKLEQWRKNRSDAVAEIPVYE